METCVGCGKTSKRGLYNTVVANGMLTASNCEHCMSTEDKRKIRNPINGEPIFPEAFEDSAKPSENYAEHSSSNVSGNSALETHDRLNASEKLNEKHGPYCSYCGQVKPGRTVEVTPVAPVLKEEAPSVTDKE